MSHKIYLLLITMLLLGVSNCNAIQRMGSNEAKHDYFHKTFECQTSKTEPKAEYRRYLELHNRQRILNKKTNAQRKQVFAVLTGDSISAIFQPVLLKKYLPNHDIINTGVGGDTTDLFSSRLDQDVLSYKPKVIIISIGGNDLMRRRCVSTILSRVDQIITQIQNKSPQTRIILTSIPPVHKLRLNGIILFYNLKLQYLAKQKNNVMYLDLWTKLAAQNNPRLGKAFLYKHFLMKADDIHFNEFGYKKWAELLKPILNKLK